MKKKSMVMGMDDPDGLHKPTRESGLKLKDRIQSMQDAAKARCGARNKPGYEKIMQISPAWRRRRDEEI